MPQTVLSWWWWKMAEMFSLTNAHESTWCLWNLLDVKAGPKTIRHWWRKFKETQINEKIYCSRVLEELILLKYSYYPKQSIGSMHAGVLSGVQILQPHRLYPARLLCPWNFPGKNTGMGCHFLLQGIFPTQGVNPCLLYWQVDSLPLCHLGSPFVCFKLCLSSTQLWSTAG